MRTTVVQIRDRFDDSPYYTVVIDDEVLLRKLEELAESKGFRLYTTRANSLDEARRWLEGF